MRLAARSKRDAFFMCSLDGGSVVPGVGVRHERAGSLADQADQADRSLRGRRPVRCRRPTCGGCNDERPRPAGHRRQQAWCRGFAGGGDRGACAGRRLHTAPRPFRFDIGDRADAQGQLRSTHGSCADRDVCCQLHLADCPQGFFREQHRRAEGDGAQGAGHGELRDGGGPVREAIWRASFSPSSQGSSY